MRTHLRWLVPAVLAVVFYVGLMLINQAMYAAYLDNPDLLESLSTPSLIVTVLWFVLPLLMIIMAFRGALRVARDKRDARQAVSNGGAVLNPTSSTSLAGTPAGSSAGASVALAGTSTAETSDNMTEDDGTEQDLDRAAWDKATELAHYLRSGEQLVGVELADPALLALLDDGETPVADLHVVYGQFFGDELGDEVDDEDAAEFPPYVTAGLAYTSGDSRSLTEQDVTVGADWSAFAEGRLVVTTDRFLLKPSSATPTSETSAEPDWLSLPYDNLTVIYPAPERWALVLEYDNAAPLLISGRQAPAASVLTVFLTADADEVADSPSLEGINAGTYPLNQSRSFS